MCIETSRFISGHSLINCAAKPNISKGFNLLDSELDFGERKLLLEHRIKYKMLENRKLGYC